MMTGAQLTATNRPRTGALSLTTITVVPCPATEHHDRLGFLFLDRAPR
jgi:hypothetical protein